MFVRFLFLCIGYILIAEKTFAISVSDIGFSDPVDNGSILEQGSTNFIGLLSLIQSVLIQVVLPLLIVGTTLYVSYELFLAEGDETKLKKAWKSLGYGAIALVAIAISYAAVSIISRISI